MFRFAELFEIGVFIGQYQSLRSVMFGQEAVMAPSPDPVISELKQESLNSLGIPTIASRLLSVASHRSNKSSCRFVHFPDMQHSFIDNPILTIIHGVIRDFQ